jgi:hypothetical protein
VVHWTIAKESKREREREKERERKKKEGVSGGQTKKGRKSNNDVHVRFG